MAVGGARCIPVTSSGLVQKTSKRIFIYIPFTSPLHRTNLGVNKMYPRKSNILEMQQDSPSAVYSLPRQERATSDRRKLAESERKSLRESDDMSDQRISCVLCAISPLLPSIQPTATFDELNVAPTHTDDGIGTKSKNMVRTGRKNYYIVENI